MSVLSFIAFIIGKKSASNAIYRKQSETSLAHLNKQWYKANMTEYTPAIRFQLIIIKYENWLKPRHGWKPSKIFSFCHTKSETHSQTAILAVARMQIAFPTWAIWMCWAHANTMQTASQRSEHRIYTERSSSTADQHRIGRAKQRTPTVISSNSSRSDAKKRVCTQILE